MKRYFISILFIVSFQLVFSQSKKVLFKTDFGDFKVELYDCTPQHRDMFLLAIQDSVYKDALFNRIIKDFVVQGGEHDIDIARREKANPAVPKKRLGAEIDSSAFHKIGAMGAGRDDNLDKASFFNQIYFVVGKKINAADLDKLEAQKGVKFTNYQRKEYLENGGLPRLDYDYTVFGQVYEGLDVLIKISKVKTDSLDYPLQSIPFKLSLIPN